MVFLLEKKFLLVPAECLNASIPMETGKLPSKSIIRVVVNEIEIPQLTKTQLT
jgi:hypothetical protein